MATALRDLAPGDEVNLEIDLLARYTERLLGHARGGNSLHRWEPKLSEL